MIESFGCNLRGGSGRKLGGELNSPVVKGLIKGLLALISPTCAAAAAFLLRSASFTSRSLRASMALSTCHRTVSEVALRNGV
eukprot:1196249-Prorocentrum_minimum.AAC.1